jgi:hypothetical protein
MSAADTARAARVIEHGGKIVGRDRIEEVAEVEFQDHALPGMRRGIVGDATAGAVWRNARRKHSASIRVKSATTFANAQRSFKLASMMPKSLSSDVI